MNIHLLKMIFFLVLAFFSSTSFSNSNSLFSAGVPTLAPMLEDVTPAVVNIYTISETQERNNYIDDPFLRKFFNIPGQSKSRKKNQLTKHAEKSNEVAKIRATFSPIIFHPKPARIAPTRGEKMTKNSIEVSPSSYLRLQPQSFPGYGKNSLL